MGFEGGCLCGAVRYRVERRYLNAIHCYCSMCRKAHGTAFSTHTLMRPDQLNWLAGKETLVPYASSPGGVRAFCPQCGTHVVVHGQSGDGSYAVPVGTLDGDPALTVSGHMFTADRVNWFEIQDDLPQHEGWPAGSGPGPPIEDPPDI